MKDFAALPRWDPTIIPHVEAIIETPRFLPSGRLIEKPGYYREARLIYRPSRALKLDPIPERPTVDEVDAAKSLIVDDLFRDFPFENEASLANAVAALLLPFVRMLIDGPTPLHLFEASTEGTGKGKLAKLCAYPALGKVPSSTPQKEDEAEWRKALTTALMAGSSHIFIDNMYMPVRGRAMAITRCQSTRRPSRRR